MSAVARARPVRRSAEAALSYAAATAFFAVVAVIVALADGDVALVSAAGVVGLLAVAATARWVGVAFAVPAAIAGLVAYDWFYFPPTHARAIPDAESLGTLATYLAVAVLVGEVAAYAARRADVAEEALVDLAREQSALRRVATLVARESSPDEVFATVACEVGQLLDVDATQMLRHEPDGTSGAVASWSRDGRRPRAADPGSSAAVPIVVDGRRWGVMIAATEDQAPLPAGTEARMAAFTELVATAIANAAARAELAASRARIVAATDHERRRVVRDLHDGAQQRLVHTVVMLKLARRALRDGGAMEPAEELMAEALAQAEEATAELRELAHGILPSVLTRGGLPAGVTALASRTPVPVALDVTGDRLPPAVEATAYFVVAEALTNVAKHARASRASVTARRAGGAFTVEVRDDGAGGADAGGTGIVGLADRLAVLEGTLRIESPAGGGTRVTATIPMPAGPGPGPGGAPVRPPRSLADPQR